MKKKKVNHILWIIFMSALTVFMLIPIIMMITTAVKPIEEIRSAVFHLLPQNFTLNNFTDAMRAGTWNIFFRNSLFITLAAVVFSLLFNSIAGYAFARLTFRGSKVLFMFLLIGLMMPPR